MSVVAEEPARGTKGVLRAIGAVIGGSVAIAITSFAADYVMSKLAPDLFVPGERISNTGVLLFMLAYSVVFSGLGGYVTATLAARARMKHVIALAVLQLVGGIAAAVQANGALPQWFLVAVVVLPVPAIVLGGKLKSA